MNFIYKNLYCIIVSCCLLLFANNNANAQICNMDSVCNYGETYCTCPADCACDLLSIQYFDFDGGFLTQNNLDDIFVCGSDLYGVAGLNINANYLLVEVIAANDCSGNFINNVNINYDNGSLQEFYGYSFLPIASNSTIQTNTISSGGSFYLLEVTMADVLSQGSVTFTVAADDGNGNTCVIEQTLNILATPSFINPYCYTTYYFGCMDYYACNFDPYAYYDDGSCFYPGDVCDDGDPNTAYDVFIDCNTCLGQAIAISGCTDICAGNYDPAATVDDASCFFPFGGDISTINSVSFCENDTILDSIVVDVVNQVGVITQFFVTEISNTNILAGPFTNNTIDFNSFVGGDYNIWSITSYTPIPFPPSNLVADLPCTAFILSNNPIPVSIQFCIFFGCTDVTACNFDPLANMDDNSCIFVTDPNEDCDGDYVINSLDCEPLNAAIATQQGDACDDGDPLTFYDALDANCICIGVLGNGGCLDVDACNYDATADFDDGSCEEFDCFGICGGTASPGDPCDDGNASTTGDTVDPYCNCVGIPSNCLSEAGNLQFTTAGFFGNNSYICFGDNVFVNADDFVMLPNQSVFILFHNLGPNITATDLPIPDNNILQIGNFINNGANTVGQTIYVTAFGATDNGTGGPNFTDPCLTISNTLVMNMLNPVTIVAEENCNNDSGEFFFQFFVGGGLPEQIPGLQYNVTGNFFNGLVDPLTQTLIGPIIDGDGETYQLFAEDDNFCGGDLIEVIQCIKVSIELKSFTGEAKSNHNLLNWSTSTEFNNSHFLLQKSADGVNFETIATIQSLSETTSQTSSYSYNDFDINDSKLDYYKLIDVDLDGNTNENGVIVIERNRENNEILTLKDIYPNPAKNELNIVYNSALNEKIALKMYNVLGETVLINNLENNNFNNQAKINVNNLPKGVYYLSITLQTTTHTKKIIIE